MWNIAIINKILSTAIKNIKNFACFFLLFYFFLMVLDIQFILISSYENIDRQKPKNANDSFSEVFIDTDKLKKVKQSESYTNKDSISDLIELRVSLFVFSYQLWLLIAVLCIH